MNQINNKKPIKIEVDLCDDLIDRYDKTARQLFNLAAAWDKFKNRR